MCLLDNQIAVFQKIGAWEELVEASLNLPNSGTVIVQLGALSIMRIFHIFACTEGW